MSDAESPDVLWAPIVTHGMHWCAPNIHAQAHWLQVGNARWRVSLTTPTPRNSYVVSSTGQYLEYALEEVRQLPSALHRALSRSALLPLSPLLRTLDPVVMLDALPVSTVLHTQRTEAEWRAGIAAARDVHRGRPIVVRSLDPVICPEALAAVTAAGLELIPSRLVFHQDPRQVAFWQIRNVRQDLAMIAAAPLEHRSLAPSDATQVAALYWQLYGEKHSRLNPEFSAAWLAHGMAAGVLRGAGLIHDGRLAAAYLSYTVDNVMTNPVFGYDTTLPQSLGLYRRLSVLTMQDARDRGLRLHASSGAPGFKASRGGVPTIEYHAIDLRTVTGVQGAAWRFVIRTANAIGPRLLQSAT
jgi:Acetyltransferase (GNAT) domain